MRRSRVIAAVLIAAVLVIGPGVGAAVAGIANPYAPDVVVATAPPGKKAFFPGLTIVKGQHLVAANREGAGHIGQDGRIMLVDSTDGGRTWSPPRLGVDSPADERDPKLTTTRSGDLLMSYFVTDWSVTPNILRGTFVVRSTDGGATWSEPAKVGSAMDCGCGSPSGPYLSGLNASHGEVTELPNGDLLVPLYGNRPNAAHGDATVVRSTDGGRTWPKESESVIAAGETFDFQEPTLTVLKNGQLVVLIRTSINIAYLSRSTDGGRTWSPAERTDMPASSHHLLTLTTGDVLLTYGDLSKKYSPGRPTVGTIVRNPMGSWNGFATKLLYDSSTGGVTSDQANPASVEVRPGEFLTLTYNIHSRSLVGVFTKWADYLPPPPPLAELDLKKMQQEGTLTVDTNLTWTYSGQPTRGPLAALDGVKTFFHSATLDKSGATGSYTVSFTAPQVAHSVGVVLKPGFRHVGTISVTSDGQTWRPVGTVQDAPTIDTVWTPAQGPQPIRGIKVEVRDPAGGWPQLTELSVRGVAAGG